VYERQRKCNEIRNRVEKELSTAHIEAKFRMGQRVPPRLR
jgi:nitrite reductase (cytochrome c-552)